MSTPSNPTIEILTQHHANLKEIHVALAREVLANHLVAGASTTNVSGETFVPKASPPALVELAKDIDFKELEGGEGGEPHAIDLHIKGPMASGGEKQSSNDGE